VYNVLSHCLTITRKALLTQRWTRNSGASSYASDP